MLEPNNDEVLLLEAALLLPPKENDGVELVAAGVVVWLLWPNPNEVPVGLVPLAALLLVLPKSDPAPAVLVLLPKRPVEVVVLELLFMFYSY